MGTWIGFQAHLDIGRKLLQLHGRDPWGMVLDSAKTLEGSLHPDGCPARGSRARSESQLDGVPWTSHSACETKHSVQTWLQGQGQCWATALMRFSGRCIWTALLWWCVGRAMQGDRQRQRQQQV